MAKFLETLDMIEKLEAKVYIPAHADASGDVKELIAANRAKVHEIAEFLVELCREPKTFEKILKAVFDRYGLVMDDNQHVLVGSTIKSYLSYLYDGGRVKAEFIDNEMLWSAAQ